MRLKPRGKEIKAMRDAKKITQQDVANYLRLSVRQYQKYEASEDTKASNLIALALYFGVHVDVITDFKSLN